MKFRIDVGSGNIYILNTPFSTFVRKNAMVKLRTQIIDSERGESPLPFFDEDPIPLPYCEPIPLPCSNEDEQPYKRRRITITEDDESLWV